MARHWPERKVEVMAASIHDPRYVAVLSRLRMARRAAGLTQKQTADRLGRTQSYVSKVESGERRIDVIEALDMCVALGVSFGELLDAEDIA